MQIPRVSRWGAGGLLALLAALQPVAGEPPEPVPPPGLLEFLVEWETADGEWIDPAELESPDWPDAGRAEQEQDHE